MAFPYQGHFPFILDSAYIANYPMDQMNLPHQQLQELSTASSSSNFPYAYQLSVTMPEISQTDHTGAYGSSSSLETHTTTPPIDSQHKYLVDKKRKNKDQITSLTTSQHSKSSTEDQKSCKHEKARFKKKETEEKKSKLDKHSKAIKACGESPAGYIYVRARRGQATDSHSLAERVRREKISQRMKMLQSLVPGCEKVTGKAHMLDEIINYVQSLQNQVEFLSMKLASLSPMLYDSDNCNDSQPDQKMMRTTPVVYRYQAMQGSQSTTYEIGAANYHDQMMNEMAPNFLLEELGPTSLLEQEIDGSSLMLQVGAQRQGGLLNQSDFASFCPF